MFKITKQFHFSASHHLHHLPKNHPCSRPHGHNYIVEIVLECREDLRVRQNPNQWVRDFGDLREIQVWIDQQWDHRDLNKWMVDGAVGWNYLDEPLPEVWEPLETTAEMLAWFLFTRFVDSFPEMVAVRVSETPKTWAEFRRTS